MKKITASAAVSLGSSAISLVHIDDLTSWIMFIIATISFITLIIQTIRKGLEWLKNAQNEASDGGKQITLSEWIELLKQGEEAVNEAKKQYPQLSGAIDAIAESLKQDNTEVKK